MPPLPVPLVTFFTMSSAPATPQQQVVTRMIGDRTEMMVTHLFRSWSRYTLSQAAARWQQKYEADTHNLRAKSLTAVSS